MTSCITHALFRRLVKSQLIPSFMNSFELAKLKKIKEKKFISNPCCEFSLGRMSDDIIGFNLVLNAQNEEMLRLGEYNWLASLDYLQP